jgi:flavin-dependent dehydrogenase
VTARIATDICVLGGGPAGAVVARRLAELGHDTLLVDRAAGDAPPRAESLAPSIFPILESLQLYGEIEAAIFARERRALLVWESDAIQEKSFASAPSLLIERTRFDHNLRRAAARAGVRLVPAARARAPQRLPSGGWTVPVAAADGVMVITARFLIDARGRRRRDCVDDGTPRTAAISAFWLPPDRSFAETRIEAGVDAWSWGSPMPDGCYTATIFLDAERIAGAGTLSRAETYRRLLAQSKLLAPLLHGEMIAPVRVRDATGRIGPDLIGHDFVRVGEAAVAIDPLSSQGIQDAILSAIQAGAAVHTLLSPGCDPAPALEFYRERRRSAAVNSRRAAASLYRAQFNRDSFWLRRSSAAEDPAADREPLMRNPTALPARVHVSPALELIDVPVLAGALIRRARALRHPRLEHPVAYLGGIALAPLVDDAGAASATDEILSRWTRRVPPETARQIIDWMWGIGILDPQPSGSGDRPASATP